MKKIMNIVDVLLDGLKRVLVRFRKARFGILFFINIFKVPDFITDKRVNIISKFKVVFSFAAALVYIISGIDFIPEVITGLFGLFDDLFVAIWCLGIVNEEIEKYKMLIKKDEDLNVIKGVKFEIKDEKE